MYLTTLLVKQKEILLHEIALMENYIEHAPAGLLKCYKIHGHIKWYIEQTDELQNKTRKYLPKKERQLAEELALKSYYLHVLPEKRNELKNIERYLKNTKPIKSDCFIQSTSNYYELLKPSLNLPNLDCAEYQKNTNHPEGLIVKTRKGEYVRSKSEAFIADTLFELKISYKYECAFHVNDITLYPDFTIIHPSTNKIFIWEHFGLMDNPSYVRNSLGKIPLFISESYMPGNNLIITYESKNMPLSFTHVRNLISMYFGR